MEVLVTYENREIVLEVGAGTYQEFQAAFNSEISIDPSLQAKVQSMMPIFKSHHPKFKRLVELKRNADLFEGQEIVVDWTPLATFPKQVSFS